MKAVPAATGADDEAEFEIIPARNVGQDNDFSRTVSDVSDRGTSPIQMFFSVVMILSVIAAVVAMNAQSQVVPTVNTRLIVVRSCSATPTPGPRTSQSDFYMSGYQPVYIPPTPTVAADRLHN